MIIPQYSNTRLTVCLQTVGLFPVVVFKGAGGGHTLSSIIIVYYHGQPLILMIMYTRVHALFCHLYQLQCLVVIEDTIFNILGRQSSNL